MIDERTPYHQGRRKANPKPPGTLRSFHQDTQGVLPPNQFNAANVPAHAANLHQHYQATSRAGHGGNITVAAASPTGWAEYTGTGTTKSDTEHNVKVVVDYIGKHVYVTFSHYQYWALIDNAGTYEMFTTKDSNLNQFTGALRLHLNSRGLAMNQATVMNPWMEILFSRAPPSAPPQRPRRRSSRRPFRPHWATTPRRSCSGASAPTHGAPTLPPRTSSHAPQATGRPPGSCSAAWSSPASSTPPPTCNKRGPSSGRAPHAPTPGVRPSCRTAPRCSPAATPRTFASAASLEARCPRHGPVGGGTAWGTPGRADTSTYTIDRINTVSRDLQALFEPVFAGAPGTVTVSLLGFDFQRLANPGGGFWLKAVRNTLTLSLSTRTSATTRACPRRRPTRSLPRSRTAPTRPWTSAT